MVEYVPIALGRVSLLANRTSPERYCITAVRGDSLNIVFRMYREIDECGDGSGVQTLVGLSAVATIRAAPDYPIKHELTAAVDEDAGSGLVTVSASAEATRLLPETGVWDLQLSDDSGLVKTVINGNWKLLRDHSY